MQVKKPKKIPKEKVKTVEGKPTLRKNKIK
jgi:hypothetical protein